MDCFESVKKGYTSHNRSWVEHLIAGYNVYGAAFVRAMCLVFLKERCVTEYHSIARGRDFEIFTFQQRAAISGATHLLLLCVVGQSGKRSREPTWSQTPRGHISAAHSQTCVGPPLEADRRATTRSSRGIAERPWIVRTGDARAPSLGTIAVRRRPRNGGTCMRSPLRTSAQCARSLRRAGAHHSHWNLSSL